ncbi:histidinol dehydrogenase [Deltaproteobacteria bacterium Smac51]|nr:histidinol dehydrogenase [Deltaproteobacteria bacterium Smac51]
MKYLKTAKERVMTTTREFQQSVADIIDEVRRDGDEALKRFNEKFDGCIREQLRVSRQEIEEAYAQVTAAELADIKAAAKRIEDFAKVQKGTISDLADYSPEPGLILGHRVLPVQACCCYVPGGGYPLYSSALMLAIPAKVAGVKRVTACSPARKGGAFIHPKTLVAMDLAGVDEIYVVGGAQAVAAFAYGTGQIKPVDLIVGPGNSWVAEAKRQCYGQVGIDFVAGPSEVLVLADHTGRADLIAADLLAQCEHDRVAQSILVTTDETLAGGVMEEIEKQLAVLETAEIARQSWNDYGEVAVAENLQAALDYTNERAAEHLEIQLENTDQAIDKLYNYGSLFIGACAAESLGDYATGPNHTLPTLKAARYTGGVWVGTFTKTCTHQTVSPEGLKNLAPLVSRLARGEGLIAHAKAAECRQQLAK